MNKLNFTSIIGNVQDFLGKTLEFIKNNWKFLIIITLVIAGFFFIRGEYNEYKGIRDIPQSNITGLTDTQLNDRIKMLLPQSNSKEVIDAIRKADTQTPQYVWVSSSQEESDKKAQEIAQKEKPDTVVKETKVTESGEIQNSYKGIHLEKRHKIKTGMTLDLEKPSESTVNIGYQQDKHEIILHLKPDADSQPVPVKLKRVTYMNTVKEW